jgi:uncharacterized protein YkwD
MKSTVVSFLLLAALLCASNSESRATDADAADVAAVTLIDLDVDGNTQITLSSEEELLYNLIMEYRKENGLPPIPLSKSLTFVAQTHAKDLDTPGVVTGNCNGHSWSANGNWKSCCYTADHSKPHCIWDKPRELTCVSDNGLTCYRGNGFEIADGYYGLDGIMNAQTALRDWKGSPGHNATLVNGGSFSRPWKAIGVGISRHFATVWFGHEAESEFSNFTITSPPPSAEANSCTIHKTAAQCKSTSVCGWCLKVASCLPGTKAGSTVPAGSSATCSGSDWQFSGPSCASIYIVVSSCFLSS